MNIFDKNWPDPNRFLLHNRHILYSVVQRHAWERFKILCEKKQNYIQIKKTNWWFGKRFSKIEHSMEQIKNGKETKTNNRNWDLSSLKLTHTHTHIQRQTRKYIWAIENEDYNIYIYIYEVYTLIWKMNMSYECCFERFNSSLSMYVLKS